MNILVTGATGLIGSALIKSCLLRNDVNVSVSVRSVTNKLSGKIKQHVINDINGDTDWDDVLTGIDVVVHLAARVHNLDDTEPEAYYRTNTDGTLALAEQSRKAGVKRFIYLSTIKVNGEQTVNKKFTADDPASPHGDYAKSKQLAEQGLLKMACSESMKVVIIRPPLVYGPGVKANFEKMMIWIMKQVPLPFGSINNKRSLVAIDNLIDLILNCLTNPAAENQVFLVSDDYDLSTTDLIIKTANAMKVDLKLISFPEKLLKLIFFLVGKNDIGRRLTESLQVDISKTKSKLNWHPVISFDDALKKTIESISS